MTSSSRHPATATPLIVSQEIATTPFSQNIVQLTQAEHIELKWQGNYWKRQHEHLKSQNEELKQELGLAHAKIRDLKQRLYGKKNEKGTTKRDQPRTDESATSSRPRGQQKGSQGHGRTARPDLPVVDEERDVAPEDKQCCICGKAYDLLGQTEDSKIIEIQVKAHVR
ncbi:MAG: hypothetical protein GY792_13935, partial [Gammaproteobacteria bacterium]|nr:hypothetical protein [Gammaproteobacteria bacterium]